MNYYAISEKGNREINEDHFLAEKIGDTYVFVVADGVGGLSHADIASEIAIKEFKNYIEQEIPLVETFFEVNRAIINESQRIQTNMATTLVSSIIPDESDIATIAHVGDSRAYLFDSEIWRTKDHSLVQELVELRIINDEEAFCHPEKSRMKQALGSKKKIDVEVHEQHIKDSVLLLCSDGLSDFVRDEEIFHIATRYQPEKACKLLVKKAKHQGSLDDITIIIANIGRRKAIT